MKKLRMFLVGLFVVALILSAFCSCVHGRECKKGESTADLIERVKYGVVEVEAEAVNGGAKTYGSGFVVSAEDGRYFIVTNYHVAAPDKNAAGTNNIVRVRFFDEDDFVETTLRGYNEEFDVAVLIVSHVPQRVHVFTFGDAPALGQDVVSLGYVGGRLSPYDGIVSVKDKWIKTGLDWHYVFETTATAPQGTSGGPCIDKNGNVTGLNRYNYSVDGLLAGISYKVHSPVVATIYQRIIISEKTVSNPALGFMVGKDCLTVFDVNGGFDIYLAPSGTLKIRNSDNPAFHDDDTFFIEGKETDFCALVATLIRAGT
ncbi:MAG: serine protease [Firmicutes bacterium]|nr:serine protease [Bacillota bacterium]